MRIIATLLLVALSAGAAGAQGAKNMSAFEPKTHHIRGVGGGTLAGAAAGFALVSAMKSDLTIKPGTIVKLELLRDITQPA